MNNKILCAFFLFIITLAACNPSTLTTTTTSTSTSSPFPTKLLTDTPTATEPTNIVYIKIKGDNVEYKTVPIRLCPSNNCEIVLYIHENGYFNAVARNDQKNFPWIKIRKGDVELGWVRLGDRVDPSTVSWDLLPYATSPPTSTPPPIPTHSPIPTITSPPTATMTPTNPGLPSTDGLIAYVASDAIYLIDPQKPEDPILLSSYPSGDSFPAWSPDGQVIAVTSFRYVDNADIFLLPVDGGEVIRLTDDPSEEVQLDWSPDGQRVVFISYRDGNSELYLTDRDGSHVERLTDDPNVDEHPNWSPDGGQIVFNSNRSGNLDIYLLDLVEGHLTQLTNDPKQDAFPAWSPDGNQIAFTSNRDGNLNLYLMNADGSEVQRLTDHPAVDELPSWSPDGDYIVFSSNREGNFDIFVIELASGETVQLTTDPGDERLPDWGQTDYDFGTDPWFGYGTCARDVDNDYFSDEPTEIFYTTDIFRYVAFQFRNMQNGMDWGYDAHSALDMRTSAAWEYGAEGFHDFFLMVLSKEVGPFTVELYIEEELVLEITCEVIEP